MAPACSSTARTASEHSRPHPSARSPSSQIRHEHLRQQPPDKRVARRVRITATHECNKAPHDLEGVKVLHPFQRKNFRRYLDGNRRIVEGASSTVSPKKSASLSSTKLTRKYIARLTHSSSLSHNSNCLVSRLMYPRICSCRSSTGSSNPRELNVTLHRVGRTRAQCIPRRCVYAGAPRAFVQMLTYTGIKLIERLECEL